MRRRLNRMQVSGLLHREARGLLRLGPWALVTLIVIGLVWQAGMPATRGLFQSPVTPEPPTRAPIETETPTPTLEPAVPTATQEPPQVPTGMPTESPGGTVEPSATVLVTPTATLMPLTATFTPTPLEVTSTPTVTETVPAATSLPTNTPAPSTTNPTEQDRYPGDESDLRFEWGMLVDSAALALSYTWLCCGVLIVFSIPVLFAVLWVASKRREQAED